MCDRRSAGGLWGRGSPTGQDKQAGRGLLQTWVSPSFGRGPFQRIATRYERLQRPEGQRLFVWLTGRVPSTSVHRPHSWTSVSTLLGERARSQISCTDTSPAQPLASFVLSVCSPLSGGCSLLPVQTFAPSTCVHLFGRDESVLSVGVSGEEGRRQIASWATDCRRWTLPRPRALQRDYSPFI